MLSWSGHENDTEIDLAAVAEGGGAVGLPLGDELLRFASAAADLAADGTEIRAARHALVDVGGRALMIDAAAVAANFHMMTRLSDGTGARYPAPSVDAAASTIARMGAAGMVSRR
ncbi:MAG: hypothetical protein AAB131_18185 [Actinomycetota bacterium]|jgi:hypothetical protein